ncbi:hypothetical protein [Azospirillum sp. SYSU D00513]|uniref:hypothetical protein n=1 Tax=Azospirillum sp. SYSU D00513 TaxID=2812561 RepID=UPI001A964C5E|nr:hypothetical protein [Azospirillum sp. SYSU D00513]
MTTRTDLRRDLAAVATALEDARAQAEAGAPLDLAGLDERVGALCAAAAGLPGAQAKELLPELERLLGTLDSLAGSLDRQHALLRDAAEGRPDPYTARQRATAAYGRSAQGEPGPVAIAAPSAPESEKPA